VPASCAAASAAKSAIFDSATPRPTAGLAERVDSFRYWEWSLNRDQVGRFAGFFVLVNMDSLSSSHTCGVASNAARSIAVIRSLMPNTISRFTSARIAAVWVPSSGFGCR